MQSNLKNDCFLMVGNFLSTSGGARSVGEDLAQRLAASGCRVLTTSSHSRRIPRLLDMIYVVWSKRRLYSAAQVDVYSGKAFIWAALVCRLLRIMQKPTILTLHGGSLPAFAQRCPARFHRLVRSATIVTAPSVYLLNAMSCYCRDMYLLPNPINLGDYDFKARREIMPRLVWVRSFHRIYNPELAPRLLSLLTDEFPFTKLTMIGPDKGDGSVQRTKRLAFDLAVDKHLDWPGLVPKSAIPWRLTEGDIFINTSNVDNTPVSILEAMACGLCIVSTNVGGIPYLLQDQKDALLVPPDDPVAMSNAIKRLLRDPDLVEKLSRNARLKVEKMDWSIILPKWERLFRKAAVKENNE